jgi:pimeloyl-ACP methyl ester carboxylesterase
MSDSIRIQNGDVQLHALADGPADAPAILLLHGITSSVRTWEWLVPHLTPAYRTVRLDFRGHGKSDRATGHYDLAGYVSDAAAAAASANGTAAGAPCIVIGHSLGGATAAGLAQMHPGLVRAVVLEDPPALGAPRSLDGNALLDVFRLMRESVPQLQAANIAPDVLAGMLTAAPGPDGRVFGDMLHPDAMDAMAASMLELDASVLDDVVEGRPLIPVFDRDQPITQPTLLITADPSAPDCVADAADTAHFRAVTPHAQVHTMLGSGHLVHDELAHRQAFLDDVLAFLATLDAG